MNGVLETWVCDLGCGDFKTKSSYIIRCPKCGTRKCHFISDELNGDALNVSDEVNHGN